RDLARAGVTADQSNLGAGQVVEHRGIVARRGTGLAGADDQFPREQLLERLHGRVGAGDADVVVDGRGADMDEFRGVVPQPLGVPRRGGGEGVGGGGCSGGGGWGSLPWGGRGRGRGGGRCSPPPPCWSPPWRDCRGCIWACAATRAARRCRSRRRPKSRRSP